MTCIALIALMVFSAAQTFAIYVTMREVTPDQARDNLRSWWRLVTRAKSPP